MRATCPVGIFRICEGTVTELYTSSSAIKSGCTMTLRHTIEVTIANEPIALRLLSALVLRWDSLPDEIQLCLLHDAALMRSGFPNASVLPARIMAFVDLHKELSCVEDATADPAILSSPVKIQRATG